MGKLTATEVKQAKPGDKARKLTDGGGLYLQVHPNGARYWRLDYRYAGKRKTLALGVYPEVSLKQARDKHQEARNKLSQGIDPSEQRKVERLTRNLAAADSFEAITREWFETQMHDRSESHQKRTWRALEKDLLPYLKDVLAALPTDQKLPCVKKA